MDDVLAFLQENPVVYFATVGLDNKPKVRPFQFMLEQDGKLYFCTNNRKEVYRQIRKNPYVEICVSNASFAWIRLFGKAVFSNNVDIKAKILTTHELIRNIYKSPDNPIFEIFYIDDAKAVIADFSGYKPKEYRL